MFAVFSYTDNVHSQKSRFPCRYKISATEQTVMRVHSPDDLALLVIDERRRAGVSQARLASNVGVSRQWVQRLEAGAEGVELGLVLRTLAALGFTLEAHRPLRNSAHLDTDNSDTPDRNLRPHREPEGQGLSRRRRAGTLPEQQAEALGRYHAIAPTRQAGVPAPIDVPSIDDVLDRLRPDVGRA